MPWSWAWWLSGRWRPLNGQIQSCKIRTLKTHPHDLSLGFHVKYHLLLLLVCVELLARWRIYDLCRVHHGAGWSPWFHEGRDIGILFLHSSFWIIHLLATTLIWVLHVVGFLEIPSPKASGCMVAGRITLCCVWTWWFKISEIQRESSNHDFIRCYCAMCCF